MSSQYIVTQGYATVRQHSQKIVKLISEKTPTICYKGDIRGINSMSSQ